MSINQQNTRFMFKFLAEKRILKGEIHPVPKILHSLFMPSVEAINATLSAACSGDFNPI